MTFITILRKVYLCAKRIPIPNLLETQITFTPDYFHSWDNTLCPRLQLAGERPFKNYLS